MSTIFISHSSQDNTTAKELERRLAEQHHSSVFLDLDPEKGIVAGQSWERTLYRKLRACRAVIVVCTDSYLASQWCFPEIAHARMEGKQILALQVDPDVVWAVLNDYENMPRFVPDILATRLIRSGAGTKRVEIEGLLVQFF